MNKIYCFVPKGSFPKDHFVFKFVVKVRLFSLYNKCEYAIVPCVKTSIDVINKPAVENMRMSHSRYQLECLNSGGVWIVTGPNKLFKTRSIHHRFDNTLNTSSIVDGSSIDNISDSFF